MSTGKRRFEDLNREQLIKACYSLARQCSSFADQYEALEVQLARTNTRLVKSKSDTARANRRADFLQGELLKHVVLDLDSLGLVISGSAIAVALEA